MFLLRTNLRGAQCSSPISVDVVSPRSQVMINEAIIRGRVEDAEKRGKKRDAQRDWGEKRSQMEWSLQGSENRVAVEEATMNDNRSREGSGGKDGKSRLHKTKEVLG